MAIHFIYYFLSSEFIKTVLVRFVGVVFVTFVDALFLAFIISSQTLTEVSAIFYKYLPFSQIHVLGFQL